MNQISTNNDLLILEKSCSSVISAGGLQYRPTHIHTYSVKGRCLAFCIKQSNAVGRYNTPATLTLT